MKTIKTPLHFEFPKNLHIEEFIISCLALVTVAWSASCFFAVFGKWAFMPTLCIAGIISFFLCICVFAKPHHFKTKIFRLPQITLFQKGNIKRRKKRINTAIYNTHQSATLSR